MSQEQLTHISKVHISKLWGKYDIEWNLHKDVNILSGLNGSGKSTVLRIIYETIKKNAINKCAGCHISFTNNTSISTFDSSVILESYDDPEMKAFYENEYGKKGGRKFIQDIKEQQKYVIKPALMSVIEPSTESTKQQIDNITINIVQTFDNIYGSQTQTNPQISHLDVLLQDFQKQYLNYQLDLNKRQKRLVTENISSDVQKDVYSNWNYFLNTIDSLFKETSKQIDREQNELAFVLGETSLSVNNLSAGEKQLILTLGAALIQDCKPSILLLDEPEISLHTDWQEELLDIIRTLNPNAQLIVVTHSPSMIINGWLDRITTMEEITIK